MMIMVRIFGHWITIEAGANGDDRDPVEDHEDEESEEDKVFKLGFQ